MTRIDRGSIGKPIAGRPRAGGANSGERASVARGSDDSSPAYAAFLSGVRRELQLPYRWNLKRLKPGYTLDVGCGVGRNLAFLDGVGIDPNETCVKMARSSGLKAFTPTEFSAAPETFDSLLFAHVLEHVDRQSAEKLLNKYLSCLKPHGQVIIICPQEAGFRSDPTHVHFCDFKTLTEIVSSAGLIVRRSYSFPFPRWAGDIFKYNEFVLVAARPSAVGDRSMRSDAAEDAATLKAGTELPETSHMGKRGS